MPRSLQRPLCTTCGVQHSQKQHCPCKWRFVLNRVRFLHFVLNLQKSSLRSPTVGCSRTWLQLNPSSICRQNHDPSNPEKNTPREADFYQRQDKTQLLMSRSIFHLLQLATPRHSAWVYFVSAGRRRMAWLKDAQTGEAAMAKKNPSSNNSAVGCKGVFVRSSSGLRFRSKVITQAAWCLTAAHAKPL